MSLKFTFSLKHQYAHKNMATTSEQHHNVVILTGNFLCSLRAGGVNEKW